MESTNEPLSSQARAYFLQQGQNIAGLALLLQSKKSSHQFRKWLSIILEVIFYFIFLIGLVIAFVVPSQIRLNLDDTYHNMELHTADLEYYFLLFTCLVVFFSLPFAFLAIILGRNRRKRQLLHDAFLQTEQLKKDSDEALVNLKL